MGREAVAHGTWQGRTAKVKALLESTEIILRGEIATRIPRAAISTIDVRAGTLVVAADADTLALDLGAAEAEKWAAILRKPPPSLREKLGLAAPGSRAFALGPITDDTLAAALDGATTATISEATHLVAEIATTGAFARARTVVHGHGPKPVWLIHEKGAAAALKDSEIRATMRADGYIDTKSAAVSARMTGTLYRVQR